MKLHLGTSGFAYKEWKGSFYPSDLPAHGMLRYYAERFSSVEINNTFYRMPAPDLLAGWSGQVPDRFDFVLKAPRRITHVKRLRGVADDVRHLVEVAGTLGEKLGPVFFQLPPTLRKDPGLLRELLSAPAEKRRTVLEFRHPSWLEDDEVKAILNEHDAASCAADTDEGDGAPLVPELAGWGYLRLRRQGYTDADLAGWVARIQSQPWSDVWVFFKHEDEGTGPKLAARFHEQWESA